MKNDWLALALVLALAACGEDSTPATPTTQPTIAATPTPQPTPTPTPTPTPAPVLRTIVDTVSFQPGDVTALGTSITVGRKTTIDGQVRCPYYAGYWAWLTKVDLVTDGSLTRVDSAPCRGIPNYSACYAVTFHFEVDPGAYRLRPQRDKNLKGLPRPAPTRTSRPPHDRLDGPAALIPPESSGPSTIPPPWRHALEARRVRWPRRSWSSRVVASADGAEIHESVLVPLALTAGAPRRWRALRTRPTSTWSTT